MAITKKRRLYSASEKVTILKKHLQDKIPISDLCTEYGMVPSAFYKWQKELFDNAILSFEHKEKPKKSNNQQKQIKKLEAKLNEKHEVISELMLEHIKLKKLYGEI